MTDEEISAYIRGYEIREIGNRKMIRWAVAAVINMWAKKSIKPEDLMKFSDEIGKKTEITKEEKERAALIDAKWAEYDKKKRLLNG